MDSAPTDLQQPAIPEARPASLAALAMSTIISASLLYLGTGLSPLPWLVMLAPLPVLIQAYRSPTLTALAAVALCWTLAGLNLFGYLRGVLELPLAIIALALLTPAWHFVLAFLISKRLFHRGQVLLAALSLPAIWASLNYLDASVSPHGSFGNLAYSQIDNLLLSQLLAWTGLWGLDFLLILVPTALALGVVSRHVGRKRMLLALALIPLLLVVGAASWRLHSTSTAPSIRVAALAYDEPAYPMPGDDANTQTLLRTIDQDLAKLHAAGARFVLLPEVIARLDRAQIEAQSAHWQALADQYRMTLIIGIAEQTEPAEHNASWVIQPGAAQRRYFKQHLLPFFEDRYQAGTTPLMFDTEAGRFGTAICKDLDFHKVGRDYGDAGTQLLFVPAWDFGIDGHMHARMAVFRGIENGFAILRSARRGEMTVSDALGRIVASTPSNQGQLIADVPVTRHEPTLYQHIGDAFAWACLILSAVAVLVAIWPNWGSSRQR